MITWAHQAAPSPQTEAAVPLISDRPAALRPSTVAGPTNGPASMLAGSPDRLTWPEIAAPSGSVATCAASGTVIESAAARGSQRPRTSDQLWAHQTIPPL